MLTELEELAFTHEDITWALEQTPSTALAIELLDIEARITDHLSGIEHSDQRTYNLDGGAYRFTLAPFSLQYLGAMTLRAA